MGQFFYRTMNVVMTDSHQWCVLMGLWSVMWTLILFGWHIGKIAGPLRPGLICLEDSVVWCDTNVVSAGVSGYSLSEVFSGHPKKMCSGFECWGDVNPNAIAWAWCGDVFSGAVFAMAAAVNLQRDAGIVLSNLQILSQFVTSLHRMSS